MYWPLQPTNNKYIACQISHTFAITPVQWKASANIYIFLIYVTNCRVFLPNLYYQQRLSLMGNASDFFIVDIQQPPFPSKYTKPTLPTFNTYAASFSSQSHVDASSPTGKSAGRMWPFLR